MLCPKDSKPCLDDLCHGAGCLQMDGYPMLVQCDRCGDLIEDCSSCTCEDADDDFDWPDDDEEKPKQQASPELQTILADAVASAVRKSEES